VTVVSRLGYLAIGVADLPEATEFYSRFVRLDVTERIGRTAFMTGGLEHHWLRLEEGGGSGLKRVGYVVDGESGPGRGPREAGERAVRIHGGYGYSTEFDVERYFRDAPLMIVGEGTNEIQRNVITRQLIKRQPVTG
jgi:catechol 2,3-dioxygenase-like lactoylglutathione lyase family enzyme